MNLKRGEGGGMIEMHSIYPCIYLNHLRIHFAEELRLRELDDGDRDQLHYLRDPEQENIFHCISQNVLGKKKVAGGKVRKGERGKRTKLH